MLLVEALLQGMVIEHIFGSKTRYRLIWAFLRNPGRSFYVRELTRECAAHLNAIRRELALLERIGLVCVGDGGDASGRDTYKKFFSLNQASPLAGELKALFMKDMLLGKDELVARLERLGRVELVILTGRFLDVQGAPTDVLVVGAVGEARVARLLHSYERTLGHEIRHTCMPLKEFLYRRDVIDRFLYSILEEQHVVVVDRIYGYGLETQKNILSRARAVGARDTVHTG